MRHDYVAGKADWLAFGLPYEGTVVLAGQALSPEVPTCSVHDRLGEVRRSRKVSPYGVLVVLNAHGVVLGRLGRAALDADDDAGVEGLMREGPTTVRPSEELRPLLERMRAAEVDGVLVTSSDRRLLGLLERRRGEHVTQEPR